MKDLLLALFFATTVISVKAQNKLAAILEIGGAGILSVNAEYAVLQKDRYQINLRVGFGYLPESNHNLYSVPIGGNLVYKLKNRHHLETGAVVSYLNGFPATNAIILGERLSLIGEGIYFSPSLGYRYDMWDSGLILRLAYSPLIVLHDFVNRKEMEGDFESQTDFPYEFWENEVDIPIAENRLGFVSLSVGHRF
jgi:hypothetical protein